MKDLYKKISEYGRIFSDHHIGAYAAQSAYFFVLSMIPIILLLLTLVQFTPVTKADVLKAVVEVFPTSVDDMIVAIVNQVYNQSRTIIPITAIVAMWSAGKGVLSMTSGLNCIYESTETRNYIFLRLRATVYTLLFIIAIVLSLVLSVFGNSLSLFIYEHAPVVSHIIDIVIRVRTLFSLVVLTGIWILVYRFLPNRKNTTLRKQLPGALFTACGWLLLSFIFSIYLDIFTGFSDMYGSLTTIVLIMLWLYACMYAMLLGGELNAMTEDFHSGRGILRRRGAKERKGEKS